MNIKILTSTALILFSTNCFSGELYKYKVYGKNKETGLVVAGEMEEVDKNGRVKAKIHDELLTLKSCNGTWTGKGKAEVKCENGHRYKVTVVR